MTAETVLEARDLHRFYEVKGGMFSQGGTVKALSGATFNLEAGKTLAVVGESGCGKSTLARLVTLIENPTSGALKLGGMDVATATSAEDRRTLRQMVQIVFQDPYGSLNPRQKIGAILEEPLKINTSMSAPERKQAVMDMMARVGLRPEAYYRYPHMFSGGQRQRIAIARALMLKPKIVILDEPVSALDVSIQAQVLNLLTDLQQEMNLAYLFISHDLSVVRHIADEVMVMYLGRPVEYGTRDQIFSDPQHPYTRALLSATPMADPNKKRERIKLIGELPSPLSPPSGCAFHPRCPLVNDRCKSEGPVLHHATSGWDVSCHAVEEGRKG
ncbi:dipeptide ABC transporter ATP-binding protein [Aestuariispira insulae]|uniref:Dipeptide transport system ATP-binding protein n=1 Tax=Aestuariispira insulae TaxID=1461337 RepID=A0A3D9HN73_9PROT|nr:dipeptide ABC transporter ATP-binding protein [Aestuariispira insulae]RED50950.1 dipeptide transport system ATP-binding protein [Aestuariispira insulae]